MSRGVLIAVIVLAVVNFAQFYRLLIAHDTELELAQTLAMERHKSMNKDAHYHVRLEQLEKKCGCKE